jgi:hypothetical protein
MINNNVVQQPQHNVVWCHYDLWKKRALTMMLDVVTFRLLYCLPTFQKLLDH